MADIELSMDGPHSPERTREVALLAAECVRYLDHATMPGQDGLEYPADAERVLGDLGTAVERLPQLIVQMQAFLADWQASGQLADDHGRDATTQVAKASYALGGAHASAAQLAAGFREAQNAISRLYVKEGTDGVG